MPYRARKTAVDHYSVWVLHYLYLLSYTLAPPGAPDALEGRLFQIHHFGPALSGKMLLCLSKFHSLPLSSLSTAFLWQLQYLTRHLQVNLHDRLPLPPPQILPCLFAGQQRSYSNWLFQDLSFQDGFQSYVQTSDSS